MKITKEQALGAFERSARILIHYGMSVKDLSQVLENNERILAELEAERAKPTVTMVQAEFIADKTYETAYSAKRYGRRNWRIAAKMLAERGYTDAEIEAILRSKWTRWADDARDDYSQPTTGQDLLRWMDLRPEETSKAHVAQLVEGTNLSRGTE